MKETKKKGITDCSLYVYCLLVEVIRALLGEQSNIEEVIYMEF